MSAPPNVAHLRAFWSLFDGISGRLNCNWGVLVLDHQGMQPLTAREPKSFLPLGVAADYLSAHTMFLLWVSDFGRRILQP